MKPPTRRRSSRPAQHRSRSQALANTSHASPHDSPAGASGGATSSPGPMASGPKRRLPWPRCRRASTLTPLHPAATLRHAAATSSSGSSPRRSSSRGTANRRPARGARARPHRAHGRARRRKEPAPSTSSSRVPPPRSNSRPARASRRGRCLGATSGTTGRPKLVSHGHAPVLVTARATGERLALGPGDILGHLMPLHLAGGIRNGFFQSLLNGGGGERAARRPTSTPSSRRLPPAK